MLEYTLAIKLEDVLDKFERKMWKFSRHDALLSRLLMVSIVEAVNMCWRKTW
jgi:hypothetical protein